MFITLSGLPSQHTTDWLKQQKIIYLFFTALVSMSLRSRSWQGWFFLRSVSLAWRWPSSHCVSLIWLSLCLHIVSFLISSYKKKVILDKHPNMNSCKSCYLNYLCKNPVSKYSHVLRHWRVRISTYDWDVCVHSSAQNTMGLSGKQNEA